MVKSGALTNAEAVVWQEQNVVASHIERQIGSIVSEPRRAAWQKLHVAV